MDPFIKLIMLGDLNQVKLGVRERIELVNTILPVTKHTRSTPLIAALASENREMIDLILECPPLQVSTKYNPVDYGDTSGNWTELETVFHVMAMFTVPLDICRRILDHPTLDTNALNSVNHDDYTPLDLAVEYHPNLVPFLKAKGAKRYWRVGPGFKPNPNEA